MKATVVLKLKVNPDLLSDINDEALAEVLWDEAERQGLNPREATAKIKRKGQPLPEPDGPLIGDRLVGVGACCQAPAPCEDCPTDPQPGPADPQPGPADPQPKTIADLYAEWEAEGSLLGPQEGAGS